MAYIGQLMVFTLVIGSILCDTQCTNHNIKHCNKDNVNPDTGCKIEKKVTSCLKALLPNCDKQHTPIVEEKIKIAGYEHKHYCPGLKDGQCFDHKYDMCMKGYPTDLNLTNKKDAHLCKILHNHKHDYKTCLKNLKVLCPFYVDQINSAFGMIAQAEIVCKKH